MTSTTAVIGLGNMGLPMALALRDAGLPVRGYDAADGRHDAFTDAGGELTTLAELAESDVLLFVVPDQTAIAEVLDDIEEGLDERHLVVVHSTVLPEAARELAERVSSRGARLVDAPVSGGAERARNGALTIMVGGAAADVDALRPVFTALADEVVHLGEVGAGSAAKLANQLVTFAALAGAYEAAELLEHYDIDESAAFAAFETASGDSWVTRNWGFYDELTAEYDRSGTPPEQRPWRKDLRDVVAAGDDADLELPVARLLADRLLALVTEHAGRRKEGAGK